MTGITWRIIPDFSGFYINQLGEISDGRQLIDRWVDEDGELITNLETYDGGFTGPVWQMVLRAYYKGARNGVIAEYLDGNQLNVSLDNLQFNAEDKRTGEIRPIPWEIVGNFRVWDRRNKSKIMVEETGMVYNNLMEASMATGAQTSNISSVLHGRLKTTKSLHFKYV